MHIARRSPLADTVHLVHITAMTKLSDWMEKKGLGDSAVAAKVPGKISRSQISRIRRGKSCASPETARTLQQITGIPWHEFVGRAQ